MPQHFSVLTTPGARTILPDGPPVGLPQNITEIRRKRLASPLAMIVAVGLLYVARDVLIPLALALLFAFLLAPMVRWAERRGVPRTVATLGTVLLVGALVLGLFATLFSQLVDLARNLPEYQENVMAKIERLGSDGLIADMRRVVERLEERRNLAAESGAVPVAVVDAEPDRLATLTAILGPLLAPVATAGLVIVFVVFMLIQWKDLQERLLRLSGQGHLSITTRALEDAANRVSRYLQMQLLINTVTGLVIGLGVAAVGVPNAFLWGLIATVMRFIPYVGPWIGALLPIGFTFATSSGFSEPLIVTGIVVAAELAANNILEPWLYGTRTGVSPVGILVMAVFWAWLWGGVGLVLATPLTVCLVVAGRYLPQLEFLHVLLSDQHALPPSARLYQRLLSLEPEEASDLVEDFRESQGREALFDDVLIPALQLAERERHGDELTDERSQMVYESFATFVTESDGSQDDVEQEGPVRVLCVGADDVADHLSAAMLAQVLLHQGVIAKTMPQGFTASDLIERVAVDKPKMVVVSALPPAASIQARDRCRKLRELFPNLPLLVGHWSGGEEELDDNALRRLREAGASQIVSSLAEASAHCRELAGADSAPRILDSLPSPGTEDDDEDTAAPSGPRSVAEG